MAFPLTEQLTEQPHHDCSNLLLVFAASESANMGLRCIVKPTDMTLVGGEKWHSDWDVNVVKVLQLRLGANTPNDQNIDWPLLEDLAFARSRCIFWFIRVLCCINDRCPIPRPPYDSEIKLVYSVLCTSVPQPGQGDVAADGGCSAS